jgi:hypothetical protein
MKYPRPESNEWVSPITRNYRFACCDCGLVHRMDFRVSRDAGGEFVQFRVRRDGRATAGKRAAKTKKRATWRERI